MPLPNARRSLWYGLRAHVAFWQAWLRAPLKVGAVAPSGPFLSRTMARIACENRHGWVIELGAGSGVVTHALIKAGIRPERLLVVERDRRMCALLRKRFPQARVVHGDAAHLSELMEKNHVNKVACIVSSLPLLSIPEPARGNIIHAMLEALPMEARLVQFTYGMHSSIPRRDLKRHAARARIHKRVWLNIPPATVWCYEKINRASKPC